MLTLEEILDIHTLKRRGYSDRKIARELGIHRNTVKDLYQSPYFRNCRGRHAVKPAPIASTIEPISLEPSSGS